MKTAMTDNLVYLWLCHLDELDEEVGYVGPSGETVDGDVPFAATRAEADAEGELRADLWEEWTGGCVTKVTLERRGLAPCQERGRKMKDEG